MLSQAYLKIFDLPRPEYCQTTPIFRSRMNKNLNEKL